MKRFFSNVIAALLALSILVALILSLQPTRERISQPASADENQTQSAYPAPDTESQRAESMSPYPPPLPLSNNEDNRTDSCNDVGEWVAYTNPKAGYSINYPKESLIRESAESVKGFKDISIVLYPSCYGEQCGGSNKIIVAIRENLQHLPIEDFVEQEFNLHSSPPFGNSLINFQESGRYITVANIQALRIEDGITLAKPDIFIPHGDIVIWVYISRPDGDGAVPPFDSPCDTTLKLLDEILSSLSLFPPTK